jgi:Na+-transporting methylmalonyl-CoA/oxaloacetate decarboxylase gamma subunit
MDVTVVVLGIIGLVLSVLTICAIYYSPISALKMLRKLDEERETRNRKLAVFKTLMANRAERLSPAYVQALNQIDLEFTGSNEQERAVRAAWKELLDLYENFNTTPNPVDTANEVNAALLAAMGKSLGYDFDEEYLKNSAYFPEYSVPRKLER